MDKVVMLSEQERIELFTETAAEKGLTPGVVEKDFWVVWALGHLFNSPLLSNKILFKGGTSLSKVFNLIQRFSEDIDLILDWNEVAMEDPNLKRSVTKQDTFNKTTLQESAKYIESVILPEVRRLCQDVCSVTLDRQKPEVINIKYPASFKEQYLRPDIQLEIGPFALWFPNEKYEIRPYAAEVFPSLFAHPTCFVHAIKAERTFWEKATILHAEAFRPESKPLPLRYSRHYYDLAMMAGDASVKEAAFSNLDLLHTVAEFKTKFYPASWAHYDLAKPGSFKLLPPAHKTETLAKDYRQMQVMFFGEIPPFAALMDALRELQTEINELGNS